MAADVEAKLPGSRTTTPKGTPALDLRAGIARQLVSAGVTAIDIDPRCTVADRSLFSHRRGADRTGWPRWCGWNNHDGPTRTRWRS